MALKTEIYESMLFICAKLKHNDQTVMHKPIPFVKMMICAT